MFKIKLNPASKTICQKQEQISIENRENKN